MSQESSAGSIAGATVLIVDDTRVMLDMYARFLEAVGCHVVAEQNPIEALRRLESLQPELIVLDCMMPEMSGLDLLCKIRENPKTSEIPVVFLTASGEDEDSISRAFALGAHDYFQKPINRKIFCTRVGALITHERQRKAAGAMASKESEHLRLVEELERAKQVQHSQLPSTPSERLGWRVIGALRSCNEVGGDLFDIIDTPDGTRTLALVDVSGHGLSAALVGASVRGMLRLLLRSFPIDGAMYELNCQLCANPSEHYACVALIQFHPEEVHIVNAGLPAVIVQDASGIRRIAGGGIPPGLMDGSTYELNVVPVTRGMRVIGVTDGLTEPFSSAGEYYLDALGLMNGGRVESAAALEQRIEYLFSGMASKQPDDATLILAERI